MDPWKLKPAGDLGLPMQQRLRSLRRESGLIATAGHYLWWGLIRTCLTLYHRMETKGLEKLPERPPMILAANHTSHLDVLALAAFLPWRWRDHIFPIAAGDTFFETPAVAAFSVYALNALPMWRRQCGSHALDTLRTRLLEEPSIYILFPEGTRSRDGKMRPFKSGIGALVAGTEVPVVPCYIDGAHQAMPPNRRLPMPKKIVVKFGDSLFFQGMSNDRRGWVEVSERVEAAVRDLWRNENPSSARA